MVKLIFSREKGNSPRYCMFITGIFQILDGLVTVCSLTVVSSSFAFDWICWYSEHLIRPDDGACNCDECKMDVY